MNLKNLFITILSISILFSTTANGQMRVGLGSLKQAAKGAKTLKKSMGMSKEEIEENLAIEVTKEFKEDYALTMKLSKGFSSGKFNSQFESKRFNTRNEVLEQLVNFESYETLANSLETKYKDYFDAWEVNEAKKAIKEGRRANQNGFLYEIGNVKTYLTSFRADIKKYAPEAPDYAEEAMTSAEGIFESALKARTASDKNGKPLFDESSLMFSKINTVNTYLALLDVCKGKQETATLRAGYDKRINQLKSRENELIAAEQESVKMEEERYSYTDKESIRLMIKNEWIKSFGDEVLKVVLINSDENEFQGFRDGQWLDYDRKVVNFQIAINAKDGTHAHLYKGTFQKDNRTGQWQPEKMKCYAKTKGLEPKKMLKKNI